MPEPDRLRFPWDEASDQVLATVDNLDPDDTTSRAEHLRNVAQSVRDHRANQGRDAR